MALTQVYPETRITQRVGPLVRRWPVASEALLLVLDDTQFTDPTRGVRVLIQLSWDGKATWPYEDRNEWMGGAKDRHGNPPSVLLGPFRVADGTPEGRINNPTHVRLFAEPITGPVTVGLLADLDPDV
jgi:hypothetical protein